jgi:hypothetical protein
MGQLYDAKLKLEKLIAERKLVESEVKGAISLKAGVILTLVGPSTPDDPVKLQKLRAAVLALLKTEL